MISLVRSYVPEYFGSSLSFFVSLLSPRILLVTNLLVLYDCTQHLSVSYLCIHRCYRSSDHQPLHPHTHRISQFPVARIRRLCICRHSQPCYFESIQPKKHGTTTTSSILPRNMYAMRKADTLQSKFRSPLSKLSPCCIQGKHWIWGYYRATRSRCNHKIE